MSAVIWDDDAGEYVPFIPTPEDEREFAGTQADTLTSFVKSNSELVKAQTALKDALATLAKIAELCDDAEDRFDWLAVDRIRGVLEPTPKGKKP